MFVAWIPILSGDANPEVADLLVDSRALHFWDGERKLEAQVGDLLNRGDERAAYDIFMVYGADASWGDRPEADGSPVISESGELERALQPYL